MSSPDIFPRIRYSVSLFWKGEKSAFDFWNICPSVTAIFGLLSSMPDELRQEHLETIERFVILWYDRTSRLSSINDCRRSLFSKGRNLENIPPTQDALEQHALRAAYQAGFLWAQATVLKPVIPTPGEWDGNSLTTDGDLTNTTTPITSIPEASLVCKELIKCGCKKASVAYVNVQKQISPALNSVTVLACATETNISGNLQKM